MAASWFTFDGQLGLKSDQVSGGNGTVSTGVEAEAIGKEGS